jgi:hypothetical protein
MARLIPVLFPVVVFCFFFATQSKAQIPQYDHVVVVIEENHNFGEIIGSPSAPYLNTLADTSALLTSSHAVEHPSQPNYLDLYSGLNQGVAGDNTSPLAPFTTSNLGASLISHGLSFADYSESLPYSLPSNRSVAVAPGTPGATAYGFTGDSYSDNSSLTEYMRKHNPVVNWQNETNPGANQLPATTNQPFTAFPTNFSQLPTVSFVIPNQQNDMHDGTVQAGDTWLLNNLAAYQQWALTHNSLLIVTFDEGSEDPNTAPDGAQNRVATIFSGQGVVPGQYGEAVTHFNVLRTLEDMYGLPASGPGDTAATPITDIFAVPEPSTTALFSLAALLFALVAGRARFRRPGGIVLVAMVAIITSARATTVIAPNEIETSSGPVSSSQTYGDTSNLFPFFPGVGNALEYQQVYAASQFAAFAPGGEDISSIVFRVGADAAARLDHGIFATTIPLIQFTLSTTAATPDNLSSTFSANLGGDATTVYGVAGVGSPLAISSTGSLQGNPSAFDITIPLTTPFHYDPAAGNLLLQVQNYSGATSPTGIELDGTIATGDSVSRVMTLGSATATTATSIDSEGLVTEFVATPVPEANVSSLVVAGLLLGVPLFLRRRSAYQKEAQ